MGLTGVLSNALSGMSVGQNALDVLSRNVANQGVPGYHRQSLSVIDTLGANSSYVRNGAVSRAFDESLQHHYTRAVSDSGFTSVRANFLDRLQTVFGLPGSAGALDTVFGDFQKALVAMSTSPDNYASRADAVSKAEALANTLNGLSEQIQILRGETEAKISTSVDGLNQTLQALEKLNGRLADQVSDPTTRQSLLDQRDRLVSQVAEVVDVRVDYRGDGTVSLMTRGGVGLLDRHASTLKFESAGKLTSLSLFDGDPAKNGVGRLTVTSPSGLVIDLVQQNVLKSGELGGLIELRDTTLVNAQKQLDQVAASLAQAMSTVEVQGDPVTMPAGEQGFLVDITNIRNGNDIVLNYTEGGVPRSVRVVRVDDPSKLPMDTIDANGNRVLGLDFSGGSASVATQLQDALGNGLVVTGGGAILRVVDDGPAGTFDVMGLTARSTVTASQGAGLGLSLFVDNGNSDYTGALDGNGQMLGFASRISVNRDILDNADLMVQFEADGSLGDDDRADYLVEQLDNMRFASYEVSGMQPPYRLSGTVDDIITQTVNHTGNVTAQALADLEVEESTMDTLNLRMDSEYGVDVDEEMARLMELQNAFAANARVISTVQELLDQLMQI